MSIRALRTFIAICEQGSFAAAAEQMGLTQAAVSLQVKKLEEEFEADLFDRQNHKPQLNHRGLALLEEARNIVRQYDQLKGVVHQDKEFSGPLTIGSINTVQVSPLPDVIKEIQKQHPHLQISIKSGLSAYLADCVQDGLLDFAITTQPEHSLPKSLSWLPYFEEPFYAVGPLDAPQTTLKDLIESHPYICFDRQAWAGKKVDQRLKKDRIFPRDAMETDSLEATLQMAKAGLGVAIVSLPERRKNIIQREMKVLPFRDPPFSRTIGLIHKTDTPWKKAIDVFRDALCHHSNLN